MTVLYMASDKQRNALFNLFKEELNSLLLQHNLDFAQAHPEFKSVDMTVLIELDTSLGKANGSLDDFAHALQNCRRFVARFDVLAPEAQAQLLKGKR